MITTTTQCWLQVLLLSSLFSVLLAVPPVSSNLECPFEPLPTTLDSLSALGFNGELHLHNEYYTPFTRGQNHLITFTITQRSDFRIYIEPHYVDIDIWLYKDSTSIAHTSDYSLADEVVFYNLDPGNYKIRIYFFGNFVGDCPSMMMEISVVPTLSLTQRIANYTCASGQSLPTITFGAIDEDGFYFNSGSQELNVQYTPSDPFKFIQSYTFTVPKLNPAGDSWEIEATLGLHFPTSALGLLLQDATAATPTDLSCYDINNCSIAAHNARGQTTLKTLILPGTYTMWLYDVPRDRNTSLTTCQPFTMYFEISHTQQIEDYLNCDAEPFPTNLDEPGILDDNGYMYYRENVLIDLSKTLNEVKFYVAQDSYFRAFVVEHRIDLDLKLINASKTLAYGYQYGSTEEGIQSVISAGNYTFQLILFGKYEDIFCESALLEIAISPISLYTNYDVCSGQAGSAPDLSGLSALSSTSSLSFPYNTYRYTYTSQVQQNKVVASQSFNLSGDSYLQVQLGSNFILGDIRIWLISDTQMSTGARTTSTQVGYHRRNMHYIDVLLPKSVQSDSVTTYTLSIVTADTQATIIVGFPPCATYSLSLTVVPANATAPQLCLKNRPIPSNLNTPQNLLTAPKIHIQEEFLIPKIDSLYAKETVTFMVNVTSYFRMYTEPHHIDIDLKLEEGNTGNGTSGQNFNDEEAISWELKPFVKYTLTITYYKWYFIDHGNDPCYTFSGEIAITPLSDNKNIGVCGANNLPQSNLGVISKDAPIYIEQDYYFTQTATPLDYVVKFQVVATSLLRVGVTYDFVWNALALNLVLPGTSDPLYGDLNYNRNEIPVIELGPGNYSLHIYEPFDTNAAKSLALRNCVQFHLTLGLEMVVEDEVDPLLMSCEDHYFPSTFNTPAFLHSLSGFMVDFNRYVLANVVSRVDTVTFTVPVNSVIRLYIPVDPVLDIDVALYKGTNKLAQQTSYGKEETIMASLTAGSTYSLNFTYYGVVSTSILPPPSACAAFRIAIGIHPVDYLQAVPALSGSCSTNFSAPVVDPTKSQSFSFKRSLETQLPFYTYSEFTLKNYYLFTAVFEFHEGSTGAAMLLQAMNVTKTYNPLYFYNRAYLNEYLAPGTYNLSFHDPLGTNSLFNCAPYAFSYTMVMSATPATCDGDQLPTDLFTRTGGSAPFGGPQALDGSIHLFSDNFFAEKGTKLKDNYILFNVPYKSYLRIFLAVETGNTITANLFQSTNVTSNMPYASMTVANTAARSTVWILPAQATPYVLDIHFTTVGTVLDCNYFTLEFVLETEASVLSGLACPNPLPFEINQLPPETINVFADQDYNITDDFIITSAKYNANSRGGNYTYTMTINVASNSSLSATIGYDFIVNDFELRLLDSNSNLIIAGIPQESPATDSGNNFMSYLQWRLVPGTYRLLIIDVGAKTFNLSTFCHSFSFALSISANSVAPRVLQVSPSSGFDLNPNSPLTIAVTFSEAATIALPTGYALGPYLAENLIVYLQPVSGPNVTPIEAFFDASNTVLTLRFTGLVEGGSYVLRFDLTKFTTRRANAAFDVGAFAFNHNYLMHRCLGCSGHGSCVQNAANQWVCACVGNWTGSNCEKCADGTHGAGTLCVPNTYCNTNSCNTHGTCADSTGYPVCTCRRGYTGAACDSCAPGYSLYPNCTAISNDTDADDACTAPLLPIDLNSPAYLSYTGHMHMQGWYYINQQARLHEVTFKLDQQSLMRAYSEPHEIDIDLWLFRVNGTQLIQVAYEISFGLEEAMLVTLEPGNYLMRMRYYMWVVPSTDCATFNFEWAIAPVSSVQSETSQYGPLCTSALPSIPSLNVTQPYSFSKNGFSVSSPNKVSTDANYFYRLNITISPPASHVATLHATVGYRFLPGDISILLEAGNKGTHCGNTGTTFSLVPPPGCTYGDNLANVNTLHVFLEPGDYILWIYEPIYQLNTVSQCSPFDFSLTIDFVDDEQDVFNCNLPLIPLSLDSSQYTENDGFIHFQDRFVLDDRTMSFTVKQQSFMRAAIIGSDTIVTLFTSSGTAVTTYGDPQTVSASLPSGKYYLKFAGDFYRFCPVLNIEFALAPVNALTVPCPATPVTPALTISAYPFDFGPNRTRPIADNFYTLNTPNTPIVASYTFRVSDTAALDTAVDSNFLRGNLRLQLYLGNTLLVSGDNNYDQNRIQKTLAPGSYELRIVLPPGQRIAGLPSCIQYNFGLHIAYTTAQSPACESNPLPYTLNTMHFLGYEGTMNFQSQNWRIPTLTFSAFHNVNFSIPAPALIRVYTEPHDIDIDIKLLTGTGGILTSGSNAIGTEESFTYMLEANTVYMLQLQFYNFPFYGYTPSPCDSFNMEIEINPVPTRDQLCPNGGSVYPQISGALTFPFYYNSIDNGMKLYYQQVSRSAQSKSLSFSLPTTANIHIEIGYDFLVGDLMLVLQSTTTKASYMGTNFVDRNVINLINIPSGAYQLNIYEVVVNLDSVVACSEFTFAMYAEAYSALIDEDRYLIEYYLPKSLDSISYLLVTNKVHLANDFFMFDGSGQNEQTSFTVKQVSLLRVNSLLSESEYASGRYEVPTLKLTGQAALTTNGSMLVLLQPGSYLLTFLPPASLVEQNDLGVVVSVQLALSPQDSLVQEINQAPFTQQCATSQFSNVLIDPNGYYQDGNDWAQVSYAQLSTITDVIRVPFTLDRFSVVYLQVGSNFLLSELETRIHNAANNTFWHGRMRKNVNQVHMGIPAGNYYLQIRQTVAQSIPALAHCGFFSYSIIIKDANDASAIVDCSSLQTVPWQLDTASGGSAIFGGPINSDGTLHLYGENMYISNQAATYMNFTLSKPSLVSVLVVDAPITVDYSLMSASSAQSAVSTYVADRSRLNLYNVPASRFQLGILYRRSTIVSSLCLSYTLQIDIAPSSSVQSTVACPSGAVPTPIPSVINIDSSNVAMGSISSFFQGWVSVAGYAQSVNFTTRAFSSNFVVTLSFNSLVNSFSMQLFKAGNSAPLTTAQPRGRATKSGATNVYLYLAASLLQGSYVITITHPNLPSPFSPPTSVCAPFTFEYVIGTPANTSNRVEITDVSPPTLGGFNAAESLSITITFSGTIYSASKQPITSADSAVIANAFYLAGNDQTVISPNQAIGSISSQANKWRIVFPPFGVVGVTYTLTLKSNQLFDQSGNAIALAANQYKYTTSNCGPHGSFDNQQGKCVCTAGYVGQNCDTCDIGYIPPPDTAGLCVKDLCKDDTCGCRDSACLTRFGTCAMNASGLAHCSCSVGYAGENCQQCAPNYSGYPYCQPSCSPACVHGTCVDGKCQCEGNYAPPTCTCPKNYAGDNCDQCAPGYSGSQCEVYTKDNNWGGTKVALEVIGVLLVIALAAGGAFWYWRYHRAGARYRLVSRFSTEDDDDGGHHFPDSDNRLVDDDEEDSGPKRFEEREEEEPRVELPSSSGTINSAPETQVPQSSNSRLVDM